MVTEDGAQRLKVFSVVITFKTLSKLTDEIKVGLSAPNKKYIYINKEALVVFLF